MIFNNIIMPYTHLMSVIKPITAHLLQLVVGVVVSWGWGDWAAEAASFAASAWLSTRHQEGDLARTASFRFACIYQLKEG